MPPLQKRLHFWAAGLLAGWFLRLLHRSWRVSVVDPDGIARAVGSGQSKALVTFWHGNLLTMLAHYRGEKCVAPVSEHADGEFVAHAMERQGFCSVRGSTTHGSLKLVRRLLEKVREGWSPAITPDGPRGPRHSVQPGFVLIARRCNLPVYPIGVAVEHAWTLRSWDAFVIPKPWTRIVIHVGEPLRDGDLSRDIPLERICEKLRERLFEATDEAERALEKGPS